MTGLNITFVAHIDKINCVKTTKLTRDFGVCFKPMAG